MELPSPFLSDEVKNVGWIDVHTHLNFLDVEPKEAIEKAAQCGIRKIITIGTEPKDWDVVLQLAETHSPQVFCTLGLHPHEAKLWSSELRDFLETHRQSSRVVALGEMGLDYYYNNSPSDVQIQAFRDQMDIAAESQLPVEIHTRDADEDTLEILREYDGKVRGIIHCFTGTEMLAKGALECGYNLSFSGVVTFKNAQNLRDIVKSTPLDRMHVETDAPFLSPAPLRGKKNRPDHMLWTAKLVAELKETSVLDFCVQMKANSEAMFPKILEKPRS